MSLLLATAGESVAASDTFQMARRQSLWPQLNTAESGTWAWSASSSKEFGGAYENSSAASGNYVEWANVPLFAANAKVNFLYTKSSNGGIVKVFWNGSELGTLDTYNASTTYNNVATVDLGTVTAGRGTLRLISDTKNASSSAYKISVQQIEVVQPTGTATGADLDDCPWVVDVPVASYDSVSIGSLTAVQSTGYQWGTRFYSSDNQFEVITYSVWLAQGTYDLDMIFYGASDGGIATVKLGGSTIATFDFYTSGATSNASVSQSGITVSSTGVHTLTFHMDSKNASSTRYRFSGQWIQFRKTATTGAVTATGTTYGRETMELWPWFQDAGDFDTFIVSSNYLHYGAYYVGTDAINDSADWAQNVNSGTYDVDLISARGTTRGIVHLSLDGGADIDTVDLYGSISYNVAYTMSGSLSGGTINVSMDSKNASSSGYNNITTMYRLVRTGA